MRTSRKTLSAALAVAALSVLSMASAAPATAATSATAAHTVEVQLQSVKTVREASGDPASCPDDQVMTGRSHSGDENGYTKYSCSRILIDGVQVRVERRGWSGVGRESNSRFYAFPDHVIVGRRHSGDENGYTYYEQAMLWWQDQPVRVIPGLWRPSVRENSHSVSASPEHVMTARLHSGDENGYTTYRFGSVLVDG